MRNGQDSEMKFILTLLKSPEMEYNSNNIAGAVGISAVGVLKIARKLEKENILTSRKIGKANIYRVNLDSDYARQYIKYLLKREAEKAPPYVRVWIKELKKIKSSDGVILFGSVLRKGEEARDIDALVIVNQKSFKKVKKEIEEISRNMEAEMGQVREEKKNEEEENEKEFLENLRKQREAEQEEIMVLERKHLRPKRGGAFAKGGKAKVSQSDMSATGEFKGKID